MDEEVRLVHLADLHLGFTGPQTLVFGEDEQFRGRFVREVDIEKAIRAMAQRIIAATPKVDVVIIAGDLFHRSNPLPRPVFIAARLVKSLVDREIEVVIVDGNHDSPGMRIHTGSALDYLKTLNAKVVNGTTYAMIGGKELPWSNSRLQGKLFVHAVPYRAMEAGDFVGVAPLRDALNVLVAHGCIGGIEGQPAVNTLRLRTAALPITVLRRGWDYVALGDWHMHKHQPVGDVPAYYAGSLEAMNFGEAMDYPIRDDDRYAASGALDVRLLPGKKAVISSIPNEGRRAVIRLQAINAHGLNADQLLDSLRRRLDAGLPTEALVQVDVKNCRREAWRELDHEQLGRLRSVVRRCQIDPTWQVVEESAVGSQSLPLEEQWENYVAEQVPDADERAEVLKLGLARIEDARQRVTANRVAIGQADTVD